MATWEIILLILGIIALLVILFAISYVKAPPDTAYIITGPTKQKC